MKESKNSWKYVKDIDSACHEVPSEIEQQKESARRLLNRILVMALAVLIVTLSFMQVQQPYAITFEDKPVVYVENKDDAETVMRNLMKDYSADGAAVKSISIDGKFGVEQVKFWKKKDSINVLSEDEAIASMKVENDRQDGLFDVEIVGESKKIENYTPETIYVKDEEMFVGETRTEGKTINGKQLVTRELTTENGKLISEKIVDREITEEGTAKTVHVGVCGLPEGEDWKTYDGEPIFDNEDDLMNYSTRFVGRPYVRGGKSLVTGVDCVGFVQAIYKFYGVNLSDNLKREGHSVSYSNAKRGDILCFNHHYAIYLGGGKMIHAANPRKDVCIEKVHSGIIGVRRIID